MCKYQKLNTTTIIIPCWYKLYECANIRISPRRRYQECTNSILRTNVQKSESLPGLRRLQIPYINVPKSESHPDNNTTIAQCIMCKSRHLTNTTITALHKLQIAYECVNIRISTPLRYQNGTNCRLHINALKSESHHGDDTRAQTVYCI